MPLLRAGAARARHRDLRRRRAQLLDAAAGRRPARLPGRAGEPARRGGALLGARVPLGGLSLDALGLLGLEARRLEPRPVVGADRCRTARMASSTSLPAADRERVPRARRADRGAPRARRAPCRSSGCSTGSITDSGYDRALLALPDGRRRMANVRKLMRLARAFEADEGGDLRALHRPPGRAGRAGRARGGGAARGRGPATRCG